jgi:hypothetical protein
MRSIQLLAACGIAVTLGCNSAPPRTVTSATSTPSSTVVAERTVFNDSVVHAESCAPATPGTDWGKVCVPKDQGVRALPKPKP